MAIDYRRELLTAKVKVRLSWVLACLAFAACALLALAGCSSATTSTPTGSDTLRVGVRADVVGFGYLNEQTGKYNGLEIDIAKELASRLGYSDVEYVTVVPDNRKEMLQNGEIDCMIACYSIAESREKNFDFSEAYYTDSSIVLLESSSLISSIEDMKGLTFGAMSGANTSPQLVAKLTEMGFTSGEVLSQVEDGDKTTYTFDTFTLVQLGSYQELSDALEEGTIDAACMDGSIANTYMRDDRNILEGFSIAEQEYGVATQKDSALSQPVADAIQAMLDDGTIASLTDKWD